MVVNKLIGPRDSPEEMKAAKEQTMEGAVLTNRQIHYTPLFAVCTLTFSAFWNFG